MTQRLRFLLDTNILIPLQDSYQVLEANLANFVRLAGVGGHQLLYHPASITDLQRDPDEARRTRTLQRVRQYAALEQPAPCPWNMAATSANDVCDNEILYALECDAVHALITEDRGIHAKAAAHGLRDRTYTIQTAEDWLRRLHEPRLVALPNIQDAPLHSLTPLLGSEFFNSLREGYNGFDDWFRRKARENRMAWIYRDSDAKLAAICIYATQADEVVNDSGEHLPNTSLKLCTFKVAETVRGRKIGELFLKAAFRYATENACEHIFIHANADKHDYLIRVLVDFGFKQRGTYKGDMVLVKPHPPSPPDASVAPPLEYAREFFPHYRQDPVVQKFVIPIQPHFHAELFPDYSSVQGRLFGTAGSVGNAIKLAYLCHAQTKGIRPGDVVLFYRTEDEKAVTSVGIVDKFEMLTDAARIAGLVSRRTVYGIDEITQMAQKLTKVILFRLVGHFPRPISYERLLSEKVVGGPIQTIRQISDASFYRVLAAAGR
ncbi:GNAT family N-acetyltransferase [Diaphorobacter aerolatus]|uniref:GNAT family N-acetyltransferase n=1 Tax=Diaphorobacter aerolatus TaxID=1288495 RepID=A0A7H0GJH3_9BURK|nr:GNAT family N-acetyltransferase [Diaphorobacter aerolatus]QNP48439.1 GNAT family N-acetyltransferase [Diaphorobacter aerolatus]